MKSITLIFLILVNVFTFGQEIKIPDNFTETPIPKLRSQDWNFLNNSEDIYLETSSNDELKISKKRKGHRTDIEIEGGKLIGINDGEWGGALYFRTKNLQEKIIIIKPGNVVDIFRFKNRIFFIQGLAHMGINDGGIYELKKIKNKLSYVTIAEFDDAPYAMTSLNNKILVVSHKNFYEIDLENNNTITKIFENQFWEGLYPNSIVAFDERNVFAGIRSGILKINLIDKTIKFYRKTALKTN